MEFTQKYEAEKEFFVMLYTQNGGFTPLMNDEWDEDILKFETENEAREYAGKTGYGEAFGFEVFHIHEGL